MAGLLDNYLDPAAASRAGLFEGLTRFGAALAEAGRPRMIMREGYGPGLLGGLAQGFGGFSQGVREGRQNALAQQMQQQTASRELAMQEALGAAPDEQLSAGGRQLRGLLGQMPASARAALPFIGPEQRGTFLASALRPGESENTVIPPGGSLANRNTGQVLFQAPFAPQRPPQLDPNQRFMELRDGSIVDRWALMGGGGGAPPAAPAMPGSMPTLMPPNVGLPAPGRVSNLTPNQPPPDVAPAGGQPMLTPQPGDVMPVQGALPMAPPAAPLPPGTVRAAPPPEWQTVTEQNRPMFGLPAPREGAVWQRNSRTGETRQVGGSGVTVNNNPDMRAETAEAAKRGGLLGEEEATVRTEAAGAANTVDALRQVRAIAAPTGRLAPAREVMGGWLEAMGMTAQSRLVRDARDIQTFNALASSAVLSAQLQQKGVATEGDARRISETWAQLRNTEEGNDYILRAAEAQATRLMERDEFYQNWRQEPGDGGRPRGTVDGAGAAWRRYIRETPLVTRLNGGQVIFFNEYMANAQANSVPRDEALRIWRERAR